MKARHIKQKFGGLRFYGGPASAAQRALIRYAEGLSYRTRQICGGVGQLYNKEGWYSTKCPVHAPKDGKPAVQEDASFRITIWNSVSDETRIRRAGPVYESHHHRRPHPFPRLRRRPEISSWPRADIGREGD